MNSGGRMPWIECHNSLFGHPKTLELSERLGCSVNDSVAGLLRFWCWCLEYASDGDLRKHKPSRVASAFGIPASEGETLVNAMIETGWLDVKPFFRVHNWWKHVGLFLQNRHKRHPEIWHKIRSLYEELPPGEREPEMLREPVLERVPEQHECCTVPAHDHRTRPDLTVPDRTQPHHPPLPEAEADNVAADADEFFREQIYCMTGKKLSRLDLARIKSLKSRHAPQFDLACAHLHGGIDNVAAYLEAVLEPRDPTDKLVRQVRDLLRAREATKST
jgi:hypothetical protein